ncbi:MAG: TonB-dependent receptor [Rhodocyclaceae bacterium]|nr:TonB-dependent receptor [Rhodocyclaceae bacterium]
MFPRHHLVLALASAFPVLVLADTPSVSLGAVVVTGSRVEHNSFDLPAAIDIVGAEGIGADQVRVNASEALVAIPGITVQNRQNYAQDLQISSRGFGARSAFGVRGMRLVADGIPASMPDGQGQAASFNLDRAERIEVMRGPLSSVYGNHAGGVIQLFTKDGKGAPTVEGNFSTGSYGTWKIDLASQGEVGGVGYVVDTSRFHTDGYREHSSVTREQTYVKLNFSPDADSKITVLANSFNQPMAQDPLGLKWDTFQSNPRGVEPVALLYNTRKSIDQTQGGLSYERRFGQDSLSLSVYTGQRSVTQYQSIPRAIQVITSATPENSPNRKSSGGVIDFDRHYSGFNGRYTAKRDLAGGVLTTTLGLDLERSEDDRRGYENFIGNTLGVKGNLRRSEEDRVSSFDQYLQTEWQGERWGASLGVRHSQVEFEVDDHYIAVGNGDDSGGVDYSHTTPVLALMFKASPVLNFYVSAASGFETPTLNELFYSGPNSSFSYSLQPATNKHIEAGAKAFVGASSRLDVAIFQVRSENELVVASSSGGRSSFINAGQTLRRGIEVAFDTRWQGGFTSRLAYTGLNAIYDSSFTSSAGVVESGNYLPGIPRSTLFGEVAWHHQASGFHTALEAIARDKVYVEDKNIQQTAPGYAIANLRFGLERQYGALNLKGFVRIDNLFDKQYVGSVVVGDTNGRYYESAPGRNGLLGVSARYSF